VAPPPPTLAGVLEVAPPPRDAETTRRFRGVLLEAFYNGALLVSAHDLQGGAPEVQPARNNRNTGTKRNKLGKKERKKNNPNRRSKVHLTYTKNLPEVQPARDAAMAACGRGEVTYTWRSGPRRGQTDRIDARQADWLAIQADYCVLARGMHEARLDVICGTVWYEFPEGVRWNVDGVVLDRTTGCCYAWDYTRCGTWPPHLFTKRDLCSLRADHFDALRAAGKLPAALSNVCGFWVTHIRCDGWPSRSLVHDVLPAT